MTRLGKLIFSLLVLIAVAFVCYRVYRLYHPHYIPIPPRAEVSLTIIPGWNLRQVAEYLVLKGFATTTEDVYRFTGIPANDYRTQKLQAPVLLDETGSAVFPNEERDNLSYEGYVAPETFRVFADASVREILLKFVTKRYQEIQADDILPVIHAEHHTVHEVITMASIVEKEAKTAADRRLVADILWRRNARHSALQVDSSVHYAIDKTGDVFTTDSERNVASPWNTYKYPGLPPGPICNPSLDAIKAALDPTPNSYWYFLSGRDGVMHYAKTLEEHNLNKKYL